MGIPVAPSLSTFRVNLGGYFSSSFFISREEVLFDFVSVLVVSSNCCTLTQICPLLQDGESKYAAAGEPDAGRGLSCGCPGYSCDHAVAVELGWPEG